jgi:hypothetical protein
MGLAFVVNLPVAVLYHLDLLGASIGPFWLATAAGSVVMSGFGVLILTLLMHTARGIGRIHARIAKRFLVTQE